MPTSIELRQKRATIIEQMKDAARKAEEARAAGNPANDWDQTFDRAEADERELSKSIARAERMEALEKEQAGKHLEELDKRDKAPGSSKETEYRDAFKQWFTHGPQSLTQEERQILGQAIPEKRAQSTTGSAGGFLIAPDYSYEIERAMKEFSGIMQVCRIVPTSTGVNLPWPTNDATARKATLVAENATSTPTDFVFAQKSLDAYMYRDMAAASLELIQDSAFDLGAFVSDTFSESFGRGYNTDLTNGTGSAQPNGVVTASTLGKTTASATALTRAEIVDLIHSVDPAYRKSPKCGLMFSDAVLAGIKKLSVATTATDASPLWQPSMRDGAPDKIEGFPFWINQDMETAFTTGKKLILFGDFNKYIMRSVLGLTMRRLEERFIDSGQIGFICFARMDGELINTAAVKHLKLA